MILYRGTIYEDNKQNELLASLYQDCLNTLSSSNSIDASIVINACDVLYQKIVNHEFDDIVLPLLKAFDISTDYYSETIKMFSKEGLEEKVKIELGENYCSLQSINNGTTKRKYAPLGILFHIAAGNVDVLPAFSVIEGLLAGNINILKLPTGDSGVSIKLLSELIKIEPLLKEYIYVFDMPSTELDSIQTLMNISNATIVWGGDAANEAVRKNAPINSKIISWGHKLSFAYVTKEYKREELLLLAEHICRTNQTLCSSCQGLYFDTDNQEELVEFGKVFFEALKQANKNVGREDLGMIGRNTFQLYSKSLEEKCEDIVLNEDGVSVVIKQDKKLELSYMFRNVWIKKLPRNEIVKTLHENKEHLQSAALLCGDKEKEELGNLLFRAGVTRATGPNPSRMFLGETHDGEFALKKYTKIVELD